MLPLSAAAAVCCCCSSPPPCPPTLQEVDVDKVLYKPYEMSAPCPEYMRMSNLVDINENACVVIETLEAVNKDLQGKNNDLKGRVKHLQLQLASMVSAARPGWGVVLGGAVRHHHVACMCRARVCDSAACLRMPLSQHQPLVRLLSSPTHPSRCLLPLLLLLPCVPPHNRCCCRPQSWSR
jgi:hypothetical protein